MAQIILLYVSIGADRVPHNYISMTISPGFYIKQEESPD